MTQVTEVTHSGLEHLLLAAMFGRTARIRNASSPPCPDHHTRERKKKQKLPDLHWLSIAQSGTGRCVSRRDESTVIVPPSAARGYRAISSALADPVGKVGNVAGAGRLYIDIATYSLCPYLIEGPPIQKSTFSTCPAAEAIPRQ